jgi:hypothetical protein
MTEAQQITLGMLALTTALFTGLHQVHALRTRLQKRDEALDDFSEFYIRNQGTCIALSPTGTVLLRKLIETESELCDELIRQQFWFMNASMKLQRLAPLIAILNEPPPTSPASRPTPRTPRGVFHT